MQNICGTRYNRDPSRTTIDDTGLYHRMAKVFLSQIDAVSQPRRRIDTIPNHFVSKALIKGWSAGCSRDSWTERGIAGPLSPQTTEGHPGPGVSVVSGVVEACMPRGLVEPK